MDEITHRAKQLNEATRRGDLAAAYALVKGLRTDEVSRLMLEAGFAVIAARKRHEFFRHVEQQIADAVRLRLTGAELRKTS